MKKSRNIKYIAALAALCVCVGGCSQNGSRNSLTVNIVVNEEVKSAKKLPHDPIMRSDGRKFKIAVVDSSPYNETFRMMYYLIESLKEDGWMSYKKEKFDFDPQEDSDTLDMLNWLADNADSKYLEFDKNVHYYTSVRSDAEIYNSLKYHIEELKDVDLILALGTSSSIMLQKFDFDIPLLMYDVSDAVGSKLVKSAEDSGDKRYWAHIDSAAYERQMKYYYEALGFKNIGSVYKDKTVAGILQYEQAAKNCGFRITEYKTEMTDDANYYDELKKIYRKMIDEDKVDAYILNTDIIPDVEKAKELMQIFFDENIPVFAQSGLAYVEQGAALMLINPCDPSQIAPFASYVIGAVLNGANPGDIEQEYISSPYLTLNLDIADKIGFRPPFEMLTASEKIICQNN